MAIKEPPQTAFVPERYRFTRSEYYAMDAAGIFNEDSGVELIRGDVIALSPKTPRHAAATTRLSMLFGGTLASRTIISVHNPIVVNEDTEPLPDLALLKPRADFYSLEHPGPQDLFLVVEISDASLSYDRDVKLPLYADAPVNEVWLLNLLDTELEVYRDPGPKGYRSLWRLSAGDNVSPLAFPDLILPVAALLPPGD